MYDLIIIGAGPAGLTASIYGRRANKKVLVLEALNYGGKIINVLNIENYPVEEHISGFDFATRLYNQAVNIGAIIKFETISGEILSKEPIFSLKVINISLSPSFLNIKTSLFPNK